MWIFSHISLLTCGGLPKPCSDMLDGAGMQQIETDLLESHKG